MPIGVFAMIVACPRLPKDCASRVDPFRTTFATDSSELVNTSGGTASDAPDESVAVIVSAAVADPTSFTGFGETAIVFSFAPGPTKVRNRPGASGADWSGANDFTTTWPEKIVPLVPMYCTSASNDSPISLTGTVRFSTKSLLLGVKATAVSSTAVLVSGVLRIVTRT